MNGVGRQLPKLGVKEAAQPLSAREPLKPCTLKCLRDRRQRLCGKICEQAKDPVQEANVDRSEEP